MHVFLPLFFFAAVPSQVPHQEEIERYINCQMDCLHIPGLSLGVLYRGSIYKKAFRHANLEWNLAAGTDTVYEIASMSKPFVATGIMMLVRDGSIHMEDKIRKYLPELPITWDRVTLRHLLTHTSGVKEYLKVCEFSFRQDYSDKDLLDLVSRYPLDFPPGDQFGYSNTGYCLLGMVIQRKTGMPFRAFLDKNIFAPLKMTATRVNDSTAIVPNRASGYAFRSGKFVNADFVSPTQLAFADCALISTLDDLIKWDKEMWNKNSKILPKEMLNTMWTPATLNHGGQIPYGLGFELFPTESELEVTHSSAIQGFRSIICRFLNAELTVIVLINSDLEEGKNYEIAYGVANRVYANASRTKTRPQLGMRVKGAAAQGR
ncbi:MAG: serine hydrolase domain-containing protein [Thermoguttaceae bacterium]|jgi:CubicO group peptidase (beta-lactamase class C family)